MAEKVSKTNHKTASKHDKRTITKTVRQYNAMPVSPETMKKFMAIAADYRTVKNYVYERYGGIRSLDKLYPGYTVQNELTKCGLRKSLGLPAAYFYLAMFEALVDIRNQWDKEKAAVGKLVHRNENFSDADKHYLRFILSVDSAFRAVLNYKTVELKSKIDKHYRELANSVDAHRLDNYLRRKIRQIHITLNTNIADRFSVTSDGYRYDNHGIFISTKENRQRVFVPLTDNNGYSRQLEIKLVPKSNAVVIQVPIEVKVKQHTDYVNHVGLAMGMKVMLTTDNGHTYGEKIFYYHKDYTDWLRTEHIKYQKNVVANPGRKKYEAAKRRRESNLHSYINREINRLLAEEKPCAIYIMKFPQGNKRYGERTVSYSIDKWHRGYIRKQLMLKCRENAIEFVEVSGKGIADECSQCGATGKQVDGVFSCVCGHSVPEKQNVAQNAKIRGIDSNNLHFA